MVKKRFDDASRFALTTNLAAWVTAYIELEGEVAIEAIDREYLSSPTRSEEEIRAVITALSVHGRDGHTHLRDRIVRSYDIAIQHHPNVTELTTEDLDAWRVNGPTSKLVNESAR